MGSRKYMYWFIALDAIVVIAIVAWLFASARGTPARPPNALLAGDPPPVLRFGDFTLTDLDGEPIDAGVLDGQLTLVDFFFTGCPLYCPGMTAAMQYVAGATEETGLRLLSINIDADSPQAMHSYADSFGVDFERWAFATGPREVVWAIVRDQLTFDIGTVTPEQGSINHPTRLFLVGPDRAVVGMYRYDDPDEIEALIEQIHALSD